MGDLRVPEWVKNLLIVWLSLSALWLVGRSPLYVGSPLQEKVEAFFDSSEESGTETISLTVAARPSKITIHNSSGCYGIQYDGAALDAAFDSLGALLGEALGTAGEAFAVTERRWQSALLDEGVYFDFGESFPLSTLSGWLWSGTPNESLDAQARRLCLASGQEENSVWLFWQDPEQNRFFACETGLDRTLHLLPSLTSWIPNAAFFAFEEPAFQVCDPYTLIAQFAAPAVYTASTPLSSENSAAADQILDALSFSTGSGSSYLTSSGTRYTDGDHTYLLTSSGSLSYRSADSVPFYTANIGKPTVLACIETTRSLVENTLGILCGDAKLSLLSAQEEEGSIIITYGYQLNGIPVSLYDEGWAARFVVANGVISEFTLHFRSYTATAESTLLLPELQAAAALPALHAEGRELMLAYLDSGGESVSARWMAGV